jgi:PAS domain S-box-containing protein
MDGAMGGSSFDLTTDTTFIGRAADNDIQVKDNSVSRKHMKILRRGDKFFIEDLGSQNGTWIDGHPIKSGIEVEIEEGLPVVIGGVLAVVGKRSPEDGMILQYSVDLSSETGEFRENVFYKDRRITTRRNLELIYELSTLLMQLSDINEICEKIMDSLFSTLNKIDAGTILWVDGKTGEQQQIISRSRDNQENIKFNYSRTIVNRVMREGKAIIMSDTSLEDDNNLSDSIELEQIKSFMCVPLISRSGIRGVIYVHSVNTPYRSRKEDLHLLTGLSSSIALALENASLYSERKSSEEALQKAHDELEDRVEKRTVELSQANRKLKEEIKERMKIESELREANEEIENLVSSLSAIFVGLSADYRIIRWNAAAKTAFGFESETVLGQTLTECDIQWDWHKVSGGISKCQKEGRPVRLDEVRFKRVDARDGFLEITINPVKGNGRGLSGLSIMGADITETKIMEHQLMQAQKLESIGELAAGIAHEINTPTQYVGDNTRFLQDAFKDLSQLIENYEELFGAVKKKTVNEDLLRKMDEEVEEIDIRYLMDEIPTAIHQTLEGVESIAKIVLAMKEFSHPGTGEKTAIDINKSIDSTLTVARNEWKYVAEMVTSFDPSLPLVPCFPGELNQVILNMIINAAHAIADVLGDGSHEKGTISVSTRREGDYAEISISDTGAGIPEEIQSRIFDPFFTTKEVGKGTGQGLAISHSVIVEKHGGNITFHPDSGKGKTFVIRLPIEPKEG